MRNVILLNKPVSMTPFQCIQEYRKSHPEYNGVKLGYAGRLDPMAEGLLLVLVGDDNRDRKKYEEMPKVYEFSCLFGVRTDSYDLLGLPETIQSYTWNEKYDKKLQKSIGELSKITEQAFPPFSSKPVRGKPLYVWAREGRINEIELPKHNITIHDLNLAASNTLTGENLYVMIENRISSLEGNFRQSEILSKWKSVLGNQKTRQFQTITCTLSCASGTYVRGLVNDLGNELGLGAVTLLIKRTQVGDFKLTDTEKI